MLTNDLRRRQVLRVERRADNERAGFRWVWTLWVPRTSRFGCSVQSLRIVTGSPFISKNS